MSLPIRFLATMVLILASCMLTHPSVAGIFGSPRFTMKQSDDRFSANGRTTWSSEGSRISERSIAGGTHIDGKGVFLNPAAVLNRTTGKLELLSFSLVNLTERMSGLGTPNGLGRPLRISFITGEGEPIVLEVTSGEQRFGEVYCDRFSVSCSTPLIESGIAIVTVEQYRRLLAATALAIKIDGTERSHVYETGHIEKAFIPNLAAFYSAHIARAL